MAERPKYRRTDDPDALNNVAGGAVVPWSDGVVFRCPCDERQCYISSKNHTITFDAEGVLTLHPSLGYRARPDMDRPQNWCHFWLKDGRVEMCKDAKCPGAKA